MARQQLKWDNPKSFKTAVGRLAKTYNAYVNRKLPSEVLEDQLENLRQGLGYEKTYKTNAQGRQYLKSDPNKPVFDMLFSINSDGTLEVKDDANAEKIYKSQADANKVKVVDGDIVPDKTGQSIRELYESTPTITEYIKGIQEDVLQGYSDYTPPYAEYVKDTIKETAEEIQKHIPTLSEKDARIEAKAAVKQVKDAILQEMIDRASFNKASETDVTKLFKNVSNAIDNGLYSGDDLHIAEAIVHHDGAQTTYADINVLQGLSYKR